MYFSLKIFSKDKTSLNNFLSFVSKLRFPVKIVTNSTNFKKKMFLTVLRSPHVNKDAQEQFEFKIYSKELIIWSPQFKLLILIFKNAIRTSFAGIKIQINVLMNEKSHHNLLRNSLNPNYYNLHFFESKRINKKKLFKKINKYLNLSDCYGEVSLKTNNY